jgi:hypothetical protein
MNKIKVSPPPSTKPFGSGLHDRLWKALDAWCRGLSGALFPMGGGFHSLTPVPETGEVAYDAVAADQFAAAAAGYWLARAEGVPEEMAAPLRGLIRFALASHVSVQEGRLPDGTVWGATAKHRSNNWHAPLFPAATGLLLQGALEEEQQNHLRRIIEWEADYHTQNPPGMECKPPIHGRKWPGRNPAHSCGESLAWTTALLQVARIRYPDSADAGRWREAAVSHALNAMSFPEDLQSDRMVAGRPLGSWVQGANFEPEGIQEHHGFYHPGYMAWPLASHAVALLLDEELPPEERNPEVYLHHWQEVFERLKQSCLDNGRLIYAAGFDWNQYGYGNARLLPAALFAAGRLEDSCAARLADEYLGLMEFQQERTGWATQAERMATQRIRFPNRYAWYEAIDGMTLAESLWILERVGPVADPASSEVWHAAMAGTFHSPNARLAWHRTGDTFASISWRAYPHGIQALVQPLAKPHLLKWNAAATGLLEIEEALPGVSLQWCRMEPLPAGGFWTLGEVAHGRWADGRNIRPLVRQFLGMIALPDGTVFWIDRCRAAQAFTLTTNLSLPIRLAADIFNDGAARLTVAGEERLFPQHATEDTWHRLSGREILLDRCLAVQNLEGEGAFHLMQKRRRDPQRQMMIYGEGSAACEESLVAHDLYFGNRETRNVAAGTWMRRVAQWLFCHNEMNTGASGFTVEGEDPLRFALVAEREPRILINFTERAQHVAGHEVGPRQVLLLKT